MKLISTILIVFAFVLSSCSTNKNLSNNKQIDSHFIGVWEGSEKDQQITGVEKKWVMTRKEDGTYSVKFTIIQKEEIEEHTETGKWWVKDATYCEIYKEAKKADTYKFTILNDKQIKFELIDTEIAFAEPNYTYIDTKIATSDFKKETKNDGLTMETAIKVNSVSEEYAYVRKQCQNCQVAGQALLFKNKKPIDELNLIKADGTKISYYFDISSFFGKW